MVCGDVIRICSGRIQRDNNGGCVYRGRRRATPWLLAPSWYIVMRFAFQICMRNTTAPIARRTSRACASSASSAPISTFACRWVDRSDDHFGSRDRLPLSSSLLRPFRFAALVFPPLVSCPLPSSSLFFFIFSVRSFFPTLFPVPLLSTILFANI